MLDATKIEILEQELKIHKQVIERLRNKSKIKKSKNPCTWDGCVRPKFKHSLNTEGYCIHHHAYVLRGKWQNAEMDTEIQLKKLKTVTKRFEAYRRKINAQRRREREQKL